MTRFGLNINFGHLSGRGYGDPLGPDVHRQLERLGVQVLRQNIAPTVPELETLFADHVGFSSRPHLLLPTVAEVHALGRSTLDIGIRTLGAGAFDVGVVNEGNITGVTVDQAVESMQFMQQTGDALGFEGRFYACSIPNLDPKRDFDWMRAFWPQLSRDVVRDFHRYPEIRLPWQLDDRHPWHQFGSLDAELDAVLTLAAGCDVSISEFAHSTVTRSWLGQTHRVTDEQAADYLTEDLVLYAKYGLVDAMPFQYNDGPDSNDWGHCQGTVLGRDGNEKPQAQCFARARALVGQEETMTWVLVKPVTVPNGTVLTNPSGTVRSLNPSHNEPVDGTYGPYHWQERQPGTDGSYERCTVNGSTVAYNPTGKEVVVFGYQATVPNAPGFASLTVESL